MTTIVYRDLRGLAQPRRRWLTVTIPEWALWRDGRDGPPDSTDDGRQTPWDWGTGLGLRLFLLMAGCNAQVATRPGERVVLLTTRKELGALLLPDQIQDEAVIQKIDRAIDSLRPIVTRVRDEHVRSARQLGLSLEHTPGVEVKLPRGLWNQRWFAVLNGPSLGLLLRLFYCSKAAWSVSGHPRTYLWLSLKDAELGGPSRVTMQSAWSDLRKHRLVHTVQTNASGTRGQWVLLIDPELLAKPPVLPAAGVSPRSR